MMALINSASEASGHVDIELSDDEPAAAHGGHHLTSRGNAWADQDSQDTPETVAADAASSCADDQSREPEIPHSDEHEGTVSWGRGWQQTATISGWAAPQMGFLGWITQVNGVAQELRSPLTMPPKQAQSQSSCMMQLPHAITLRYGVCSACAQKHVVRQLSNKKKDKVICIICHQCTEDGYWPAG
eukprot:12596435-Heterocapsa_arctica.AAC.1